MRGLLRVVLAIGLCSPPAVFASKAEIARDVVVRTEDFGDRWPLIVKRGILRCRSSGPRKQVSLSVSGEKGVEDGEYGINGSARGNEAVYRDGLKLLKKGLLPVALQPLIDKGLPQCDP